MGVLDAARWAPSAHNAQPWRFMVITSDAASGGARIAVTTVTGGCWGLSPRTVVGRPGFEPGTSSA
ncbi:hypothetical protein DRO32_03645 [Candidatus Bathyarchaeota archaeon]|nr:MAG: hypothetical protein DRO32_03645 [Candidatus Bathyarchaeota archaeon]